jgi:two-component system chemotaxis sensor kinase CheA
MKEEELLQKLRAAFRSEAGEWAANMSANLLMLEKAKDAETRDARSEDILRDAHSLKGAARAASLRDAEALCQKLEDVLTAARRGTVALTTELLDELHSAVGLLESIALSEAMEGDAEHKALVSAALANLSACLSQSQDQTQAQGPALESGQAPEPATDAWKEAPAAAPDGFEEKSPKRGVSPGQETPSKTQAADTVRISTAKLDLILQKAEELVSLKLVSSQHVANLKETAFLLDFWEKKWGRFEEDLRSVRKQVKKLELDAKRGREADPYHRLLDFLDWNAAHVREMGLSIRGRAKAWEQDDRSLGRFVDDLLDEVKRATMLPFQTLFDMMPRMVRDLSRKQGKDVEIVMTGGDIEIDRRILEEIKNPIIHLLRNSVDHGIEPPEIRAAQGKPRTATIRVTVRQEEGGKIEFAVSDDGGGIPLGKVKEKAVRMGLLSAKEAQTLSDAEAVSLIFRSELSTSPIITEISGRGLGMAIVQEKAEALGGLIRVETGEGKGTTIRLVLPITLATFRGILVKAGEGTFVVPASQVERVCRVAETDVKTVENRATIPLEDRALPLVDLCGVLGMGRAEKPEGDSFTVVVLGSGEKRIAYQVDEVLAEQEVVVKSLGKQLSRVPNIAGATILGSGKVVPVLNVADLVKSSESAGGRATGVRAQKGREGTGPVRRSILVVEDSITSRLLIKNILESAGYAVKTAVDGKEALAVLKTENFNAVISDVEMPRMNGFDLIQAIRATGDLSELPVVLVTSLDSREDIERGVESGANAYIVKSNFDQSDLLEVVARLV